MLEPALWEHGHVEARDRLDAPAYDLALQRIQRRHVVIRERGERNAFGDLHDVGSRVRAEAVEPVLRGRRVRPYVAAAQAPAVGERVLDAADAPAFLIEHQVVDDAADR